MRSYLFPRFLQPQLLLSSFALVLGCAATSVEAAPLPTGLNVDGSAAFLGLGAAQVRGFSGTLDATLGGAAQTQTTFDALTVLGANPLGGGMTETGDGTGISMSLPALFGPTDFSAAAEHNYLLTNSSASDAFRVTMRLDFSFSADASGGVAFARTAFDLVDLGAASSLFASELRSITIEPDTVDGVAQATSGAALSRSGSQTFEFVLDVGDILSLNAFMVMEGIAGDQDSSEVAASMLASLSIDSVTRISEPPPPTGVPAPAPLLLVGAGLLALWRQRRN